MSNIVGRGKRLVVRVVLLQVSCAVLVGLVFWICAGIASALAGAAGGLIAAVGSALFGWRMFAPGVASASTLRRAMFAGEALKWLWYLVAIWAALAHFKWPALPVISGVVVGQFGYFGLVAMRREGANLNGSV